MIKKAMTLNAMAGKTTPVNKTINVAPTSAPNTNNATDKKIDPDRTVPNPTKIAETTAFFASFLSANRTIKKTKPVTNLSKTFGIKPAGNVVNNPDSTPVAKDNKNVSLNVGNRIMPINIIVSMKSGFIPCTNPGVTTYSAAPTPTKSAIKTKFFVFIFLFSSMLY